MAITITISTNRQIKTTDGGSIGATAGMTVELVTPVTASDAEIQREIRHHYETITGAMNDQLRHLATTRPDLSPAPPRPALANANGSAPGNGTPKTPAPTPTANGNGKTTPAGNSAPAPAKALAVTSAKTNGTAKAPAAPQRPIPPQPAAQRIAMLAELDRQFAPRGPEPDDDLADDEEPLPGEIVNPEDDQDDDTPRSGIELLGWARHQPGDAKQELAQIGIHKGFPRLIKDWSPGMVDQALKVYTRTSRT